MTLNQWALWTTHVYILFEEVLALSADVEPKTNITHAVLITANTLILSGFME